eukprot:scaffold555435_cov48-Prasinocladus_malaysianus.AAC.1
MPDRAPPTHGAVINTRIGSSSRCGRYWAASLTASTTFLPIAQKQMAKFGLGIVTGKGGGPFPANAASPPPLSPGSPQWLHICGC